MITETPSRHTTSLQGAAGRIAMLVDRPAATPVGVALIGHPQPILGGSPLHPVPHAIARSISEAGWVAVRPSFRGVGQSEGCYNQGIGEAEDTAVVAQAMRRSFPGIPLALVGFSFGAYVHARAAVAMQDAEPADAVVLLGLPIGVAAGDRDYPAMNLPRDSLLIHGGVDEVAPVDRVIAWATTTHHPVVLFPGANHFFKGCLDQVVQTVRDRLELVARRRLPA